MSYSSGEARQQLLDALAESADALAIALAALSEAYEQLDEHTGEQLERTVFRPVQLAYGRARRAHAEFAQRHGMPARAFQPAPRPAPSAHGVSGFVDSAVESVAQADATLAALQDSLLPVEVGDRELRTALADVRGLLSDVRPRSRELLRTFGR